MKYFSFFIMLYCCLFYLHVISWPCAFLNYFTCKQQNTIIQKQEFRSGEFEKSLLGIGDEEIDAIIAGPGAIDANKTHRGIRGQ